MRKGGGWSQPRASREERRKEGDSYHSKTRAWWVAGGQGSGNHPAGPSEHPLCMAQAQEQEESLHQSLQAVA